MYTKQIRTDILVQIKISNFVHIHSLVSEMKVSDGHNTSTQLCVNFIKFVQIIYTNIRD